MTQLDRRDYARLVAAEPSSRSLGTGSPGKVKLTIIHPVFPPGFGWRATKQP
jgi:hypothetical protein